MTRPELGTKRQCGECGAKFYDLAKTPIVCPKCDTVFEMVSATPRRESARAAAPEPVAVEETVTEAAETGDVEVVSLEEVEADETVDIDDEDIAVVDDDDSDIEDDDDTFLEEDEDDEDDVTGLLGGGIAGEDEEV